MSSNASQWSDEVRGFVSKMETALKRLGAPSMKDDRAFTTFQRQQVERLVALEERFRDEIVRTGLVAEVYGAFLERVKEIGSVLNARPLFRERQERFTAEIGPAIQARDLDAISTARVNSNFVEWAVRRCKLGPKFQRIATSIKKQRAEIALLLMPLALSYVRVFWSRTPRSHLSFFDLFNGAIKGMMTAIDKYVPPFSKVFRSVVLGRMTGELIEAYSETLVHFFPRDRRILYRANKLIGKSRPGLEGTDYDDLAARVNEAAWSDKVEEDGTVTRVQAYETTPDELAGLMQAASCVSADAPIGRGRKTEPGAEPVSRASRLAAPEEGNPDRVVEHGQALTVMRQSYGGLTLFERKFLVLRGVVEARTVL